MYRFIVTVSSFNKIEHSGSTFNLQNDRKNNNSNNWMINIFVLLFWFIPLMIANAGAIFYLFIFFNKCEAKNIMIKNQTKVHTGGNFVFYLIEKKKEHIPLKMLKTHLVCVETFLLKYFMNWFEHFHLYILYKLCRSFRTLGRECLEKFNLLYRTEVKVKMKIKLTISWKRKKHNISTSVWINGCCWINQHTQTHVLTFQCG